MRWPRQRLVECRLQISLGRDLQRAHSCSREQCQRWVPNWQTQRNPGAGAAQGLAPSQETGPGGIAVPFSTARGQCWPSLRCTDRVTMPCPLFPARATGQYDNTAPCTHSRHRGSGGRAGRPSLPCALAAHLLGSRERARTQGCRPLSFWATAEQCCSRLQPDMQGPLYH